MEPQRGAFVRVFGGSSPADYQPLLEVKNVRRLQQGDETRYAISVTDGEFVVKALAIPGSGLIQQVESGVVVVNTLIKATDYRLEELDSTAFLLIMRADILGIVPEHLRTPMESLQKFAHARPGAAQAAQPPPWAAVTTPERRATRPADETPMPQPMGMQAAPGNPYGGASAGSGGGAAPGAPAGPYGASAANGGRSGSINDFFGRAPVANRPQGAAPGGFLPISEISPYTNGRWKIKARIITKGDIRKFSNARGEGQLWKIDIGDKSGEISATFFGKAVDLFYPQLRQGHVYSFSRGHIKQGNPRWDRTEHVLTFDDHASIEPQEDDAEIPGVTYDFKPICLVQELDANSVVDVQAVIWAVQEPFTFISKASNKEMVKREVGLWDPSGPEGSSFVNMILWGDRALSDGWELGAPIFIKGARVSEWNNQKDLSSPGVYEINPDDPRAFALKARFEEQQRTRPMPLTMSRGAPSSSNARKTIRACQEEDLQLGPPQAPGQGFDPNGPRSVHRHYVLATVTSLPGDRMPCYPACPAQVESNRSSGPTQAPGMDKRTCNKKVTNEGPNIWRCAAGHMCQQPIFRYLCRMQVMDHTESIEVNVYDNVAKQFFNVDAGEYARLFESPEQELELQRVNRRVVWRRVMLKLRSQKEVWQETERMRYNVDEASGVLLAKDARQMLAEVKAALAAA